ncbi:MAG: FHA domain-containing protein, partial [Acetobacteraceae bacterium]
HVLVVTRSGEPDREVPIGREPLIIGRAPDSSVVLGAIEVSRAHCRITLADGVVRATDLRSTNGTLINGERINDTIVLEPDMALQIGPYRLDYRRRQNADPNTDPDADPDATGRAEGLGPGVTVLRPPRRSRA